jgi:hypothetical protein
MVDKEVFDMRFVEAPEPFGISHLEGAPGAGLVQGEGHRLELPVPRHRR